MRSHLSGSEVLRSVVASTLEALGIAMWEWDLRSGRVWWSDNFGPLIGRHEGYAPESFDEAIAVFDPDPNRPMDVAAIAHYAMQSDGPVEVERRAILPDGSERWMLHRYSVAVDDDGTPIGLYGVVIDIDDQKLREREERLSADVSRILSGSFELDQTLTEVAELLADELASSCIIEVVGWGVLAKVASARVSPDATEPIEAALDLRLDVPLESAGRSVGVLTLLPDGGAPDPWAKSVVERLAPQLAAAIVNATLHHEVEVRNAHLDRLYRATAELSRATTEAEVARLAVRVSRQTTDAERAALFRLLPDGTVRVIASDGFDEELMGSWTEAIASKAGPVAAAFDTREPVFVSSPGEMAAVFPRSVGVEALELGGSWACLPLLEANGPLEALALSFKSRGAFPRPQRDALVAIAEQAGVAMDRAHLLEHHRNVAHVLQEGLQPHALPHLPGIDAAGAYQPSGEAEAGGDWFDLFETADGRVAAVIGDVVGHGVPAVTAMAGLRFMLASLLHAGHSPADALASANRLFMELVAPDQRFATAALVTFAKDRRTATIAQAGHPPAVVRHGADVHLIEKGIGLPLGIDPTATWHEQEIALSPGTLMLLYTDGWIDHPGSDIERQLERVVSRVLRARPDASGVLEAFTERFRLETRPDDAAALSLEVLET